MTWEALLDKLVGMINDLMDSEAAGRRRMWADRPGPALPLLLLAAVVIGGIVMTLLEPDTIGMYSADSPRMVYWVVASIVAYVLMVLIARHQGYRTGIWVDRGALVRAGVLALVIVVGSVLVDSGFLPGDLMVRGNLPLLALTVGVVVWAARERRPGLWVLAVLLVPLSLLANLYDMENVLYRLGVPVFDHSDQVVNLGVLAIVLLLAAGLFALSRRRAARQVRPHR